MVTIWITAKAYEAIARNPPNPFLLDKWTRGYALTLNRGTVDRLRALRKPLEGMSDVIVRVAKADAQRFAESLPADRAPPR